MLKKSTFIFVFTFVSAMLWSQIITTNPAFITKDYTGEIEITYDATQGTAGLKDYTGTDGIYAHAGVITSASTSSSDWKHAPAWGDNSAKYKLTALGNNKYKLLITPNMTAYYGLTAGEVVQKLAFVFRNGNKTKEGKDTGGADIMVPVYDAGLNVVFANPTSSKAVTVGTSIDFTVNASAISNLTLKLNGELLKTVQNASTLTYTKTFNSAGDYTFIAAATLSGVAVYDTLQICVPEAVTIQAKPAGTLPGINYVDNSTVTLVLHAPGKSNVFLIGEFNNWTQLNAYQLKKDGEYWWITLSGLTPGKIYGFQYMVDGTLKVSDPYTEMVLDPWNDKWINQYFDIYPNLKAYPEGKTEGVVATFQTAKTAYAWEMPSFAMPPRENMVIYEMLLRDFTPEKSLEAAMAKLDYLKKLGVTAVELMPIQEFDGNNSWGYNPSHYFAPDKAYGNANTYKKFIDECHKRGMAVILDIVLNHATGNSPFAALYWDSANGRPASNNPWMNVTAPHPYSVYNDFNHSYPGTRDYFKRMIKYWLTEYKVDGYRLDLTKGLTQTASTEATASNYDQSRIDILTDYYNAAKEAKSDVMFILEHFCSNTEETALASKGMYLWRNVNNAFSQAAMGYQADSDFGGLVTNPRNWVGYAESHDEERNFFKAKMYGDGAIKTDSIVRINRVPLNIAFNVLNPGPKMIWQFGEMGFDYSIDSNGGRTNPKPSAWGFLELAHRKSAADLVAKVVSLRKLYPNAFTQGNFTTQTAYANWAQGRRISLTHNDLNMVALGNFQSTASITASPSFPKTGTWYNLLTGEALNVTNTAMTINMQPGQLLIYADRQVDFVNSVNNAGATEPVLVYPSVTKDIIRISADNTIRDIKLYNIQGVLLKTQINDNELDLTGYESGLYLIEVDTMSGKTIHKVIKQ
jgi:1,4-alpha-glucan branching enzyme